MVFSIPFVAMLTWDFSLALVARVAAWSIIVGFFFELGRALLAMIPRGKG